MVLERLELNISTPGLSSVHEWIHETLHSITSPVFNEFAIRLLGVGFPRNPMNITGWGAVDAALDVLAKRYPDFRVVFTGYGDWWFVASYLPLAKLNGLIRLRSPLLKNRFEKLDLL